MKNAKNSKNLFFSGKQYLGHFLPQNIGEKLIEPPFEGEYAEIFISKEFYQIPII